MGIIYASGTIHVMPKDTPRKLIHFAAERIKSEAVLDMARSEVKKAEKSLLAAIANVEKLSNETDVALSDLCNEEARYEEGMKPVRAAIRERDLLLPEWEAYQHERKFENVRFCGIPKDPASVIIPNKPEPVSEKVREKYTALQERFIAEVAKLAATERAYNAAVANFNKADASRREAVEKYLAQEKLYQEQKLDEEITRKQVAEEEERRKQAAIAEARAEIEEAKKTLKEYGIKE